MSSDHTARIWPGSPGLVTLWAPTIACCCRCAHSAGGESDSCLLKSAEVTGTRAFEMLSAPGLSHRYRTSHRYEEHRRAVAPAHRALFNVGPASNGSVNCTFLPTNVVSVADSAPEFHLDSVSLKMLFEVRGYWEAIPNCQQLWAGSKLGRYPKLLNGFRAHRTPELVLAGSEDTLDAAAEVASGEFQAAVGCRVKSCSTVPRSSR